MASSATARVRSMVRRMELRGRGDDVGRGDSRRRPVLSKDVSASEGG